MIMSGKLTRRRKTNRKAKTTQTQFNSTVKNPAGTPVRLNRYFAMLGAGSRRACDEMVTSGRVTVDGQRVTDLSTRIAPGASQIHIDNVSLGQPPRPLVLILNKPAGVVSTVADPFGRPTVLELCKKYTRSRRLFPVGRLDFNTTGLILLTNDGALCYRLTHPRFRIPRTYHVRVRGVVDNKKLIGLRKLASSSRRSHENRFSVELLKQLQRESVLKITLREGRNRQVRRMCESMGLRIVKLRRVSFGPLTIRKLPLGAVRPLRKAEMEQLRHVTS
jgi:pseudouridine synthase